MGQLGVVLDSYSIYSIVRSSLSFLTSCFSASLRLFFPPPPTPLYRGHFLYRTRTLSLFYPDCAGRIYASSFILLCDNHHGLDEWWPHAIGPHKRKSSDTSARWFTECSMVRGPSFRGSRCGSQSGIGSDLEVSTVLHSFRFPYPVSRLRRASNLRLIRSTRISTFDHRRRFSQVLWWYAEESHARWATGETTRPEAG
ncbi:hypothetical protein BO82DRAFT_150865 [Aspergillus uvarum CBS 121591]|uniref:Uncharacterized protein n=1 Tax=Aspergillus uvarum CBS 121591 TaxID=1448315 RepID=A0A319DGR1_9EURO|nr:hypothetical protein BO82DRAFT_150865 [Aspergillus uvarum CBS 121591]PYH78872.1 hypothetical protein BO82DRAFT_150865 [Aspergillus uvarum CBS 121591]